MIDVKQIMNEAIAAANTRVNEGKEVTLVPTGPVIEFFKKFEAARGGNTVTFEYRGERYTAISLGNYSIKPTFIESLVDYGQAPIITVPVTKEGDASGKKHEMTFYADKNFHVFFKVK